MSTTVSLVLFFFIPSFSIFWKCLLTKIIQATDPNSLFLIEEESFKTFKCFVDFLLILLTITSPLRLNL